MIAPMAGWSLVLFALFVSLSLAVGLCAGFALGRRRSVCGTAPDQNQTSGPDRSSRACGELETISRQVRIGLAAHQANVVQFKERVAVLSRQQTSFGERQLLGEAEKILQPTLELANQIAQSYDEIRQQANRLIALGETRTDSLTGLCNRQMLDESLRNHFAMFSRYDNKFSIVLLDVDQLQQLNHERGPPIGDGVLQQVAGLLVEMVRETDLATRYGGDEFVLVLPETNLFGACVLAERLRAAVEQRFGVTVSGGVAAALEDDVPKSLLSRADSALYSAKSSGRNCVFKHDGRQIVAIPVGAYPLPEKFARV